MHILHDNPDWLPPLTAALGAEGVPFQVWPLGDGTLDLAAEPPEGVFWSRLSASSHTRGVPGAKEQARAVLRWAEAAGRPVVNGSAVVELEVSKAAQYVALRRAGFDVPRTIAVFGVNEASDRARELPLPFITKHNQGGKGLGVRRFDSYEEFDRHLASAEFEAPADGILLLQEYLSAAAPFVTRAEFVGGELVYAVRVDTTAGSFELCPAEACEIPDAPPAFARRPEITASHPLIAALGRFLRAHEVDVAGVEFIETADGRTVPYDINTNTNYNPAVEGDGGPSAAVAVARYLGARLSAVRAETLVA